MIQERFDGAIAVVRRQVRGNRQCTCHRRRYVSVLKANYTLLHDTLIGKK